MSGSGPPTVTPRMRDKRVEAVRQGGLGVYFSGT